MISELISGYKSRLIQQIELLDGEAVTALGGFLLECAQLGKRVFICGNGGSAGNAMHLANDFLYGIDPTGNKSLKVEALSANTSVLTCLGNDIGYENIFSHQLKVKAEEGDLLIVLSGSGNSPNITKALMVARELGLTSFAIVGFSGGKALEFADHAIHTPIDDMQISEDLQLIIGHMLMQLLYQQFKVTG